MKNISDRNYIFFFLVLWLLTTFSSNTFAKVVFPAKGSSEDKSIINIYSSLDILVATPLIHAFQDAHENISVNYFELQSIEIYERILSETSNGQKTADLAISSAMDLQMKLVNDGYASQVTVPNSINWPRWAKWQDTAFALTYEPAVTVYHKPSFKKFEVPRTRSALIKLLQSKNKIFYGRVATYDIERSGLGFLFLAWDSKYNRNIWNLVTTMGAAGVKLYSSSSAILERVSDGRFIVGYNILGSYAETWKAENPDLGIIYPFDYTVIMSRIALVPKSADSQKLGELFLNFLMSKRGQEVMAEKSKLPAVHPIVRKATRNGEFSQGNRLLRPIPLSTGLLVYLDQVKRALFIQKWNRALQQK